MKKLLVLVFIMLSTVTSGQTIYYHYDNKRLTLNPESFRRYVRPQIRSMVKEYFHVLTKMNPIHGDLVQIKNQIEEISLTWDRSLDSCSKSFSSEEQLLECQDTFLEFYEQGRKLDRQIMKIQSEKIKYSTGKSEYSIGALLLLSKSIDEIQNLNYQSLHYSEEFLITSGSSYALYVDIDKKIAPLLHQMNLASDHIITSQLAKDDRIEFDFIWANFFKELEHYIVNKQDKEYLLNRLDELNMAWNTFNMKITKGSKVYPNQITSLVKIMHNRWNNCLKIILRM